MHLPAKEAFCKAIQRLNLPRSSTIVVGFSGGPDSVALAYLARQAFRRVVAVTVDHRLRRESTEEAMRAGEISRELGVEHHVVPLDWGQERKRTASEARHLRYDTLVQVCQRMRVDTLMVGHHANDQTETMLYRMIMGSGLVGLGGMHYLSHFAHYPGYAIVRPLLDCSKSSLIQLCRDEGLEWIQDPSNERPMSLRNKVRPILARHPELEAGLIELMSLCREVKAFTQSRTGKAMEQLASVNNKYGTLSFDVASYQALNPYIARSVLTIWLRYIGSKPVIRRYSLEKVHSMVMGGTALPNTSSNCVVIPDPAEGRIMIAKQRPTRSEVRNVPIRVGETVIWDKRFKISLVATPARGRREGSGTVLKSQVFYIRNFHPDDHDYVRRGVRKVRGVVLVHYHVRGGLPVVTDSKGRMAFIPHFRVKNHCVGVDCEVEFNPRWTMKDLLNFPYITDRAT